MNKVRVLISGASIAGPALAHWLHRRGAEVTVVEQSPGLRPGGQAVDARGVAKEVIRRMGLDAAVRAACTDTAGAYTVDADGNMLENLPADENNGDWYVAEIEVLRGDFSRVLYDDTRDVVEYVFDDWSTTASDHGPPEFWQGRREPCTESGARYAAGSIATDPSCVR